VRIELKVRIQTLSLAITILAEGKAITVGGFKFQVQQVHDSIFSDIGASSKPGVIQPDFCQRLAREFKVFIHIHRLNGIEPLSGDVHANQTTQPTARRNGQKLKKLA
jgi:hypothetical protein